MMASSPPPGRGARSARGAAYGVLADDDDDDAASKPSSSSSSSPSSRLTSDDHAAASRALGGFRGESAAQLALALPVSLSMICNRVMSLTSVAFVGHLGPLPLAGAALATTLGNVTGNSIMVGMASAVTTLCGAAFGARAYSSLGGVLQRALIILTLAAIPICVLWANATSLLLAMGQDEEISRVAGRYIIALIPGLVFYAWNICVQGFMQSQRLTKPSAVAGVVAAVLHVPANVVFMRALGLGYVGAALATSWSNGVVLTINVAYLVRFHSRRGGGGDDGDEIREIREIHEKNETRDAGADEDPSESLRRARRATWTGWSARDAFSDWPAFLRLALPGVLMMGEWWASEANILIAGYLPNPERNVAGVSIFQVTNALAFMIPVGFSVAVAARAGNELGSRAPARARHAARCAFVLILIVEAAVSAVILLARKSWGKIYSADDDVVSLVSALLVPLAIYTAFDGVLCVATGVIKACGRQAVAGPVVFFAYYVVGIPLAVYLAFGPPKMGAMGLAIGATVGTVVHSLIICFIVYMMDWFGEVERARARLGGGGGGGGGGGDDGDDEEKGSGSAESLLPTVCELELQDRSKKTREDDV
jgi:multidrug resistance protein, MATE family